MCDACHVTDAYSARVGRLRGATDLPQLARTRDAFHPARHRCVHGYYTPSDIEHNNMTTVTWCALPVLIFEALQLDDVTPAPAPFVLAKYRRTISTTISTATANLLELALRNQMQSFSRLSPPSSPPLARASVRTTHPQLPRPRGPQTKRTCPENAANLMTRLLCLNLGPRRRRGCRPRLPSLNVFARSRSTSLLDNLTSPDRTRS